MKLRNLLNLALFLGLATAFVSCDGTEDNTNPPVVIGDPGGPGDGGTDPNAPDTLFMTQAGVAANINTNVAADSTALPVVVDIRSTLNGDDIDRLYVTRRIGNGLEEPFTISGYETKGDGSLDVANSVDDTLRATINFPIPSTDQGIVVYRIWATTGRGDFRDPSKRSIAGPGIITINIDGGTAAASQLVSYEDVTFGAPLNDGSSETFMSLLTGDLYRINQGVETAALWDLGYYYGATNLASFASAENYPSNIIDVNGISGLSDDSLNMVKFMMTDLTPEQFIATVNSNEVDSYDFSNASQRINMLSVGDVVAIEDQYGNKGLLHVELLVAGDGQNGQIVVNVKIQPNVN